MIRFVFRFAGLLVLAVAFVAVLYDGTRSIADNRIHVTPLAEMWEMADPDSLKQARQAVETRAPAWVWDPVTVTLLTAPGALVLGIAGAVLMLLGRRRRRPQIGYSR